jgi:pimeloyl-ACP methyl ester carboxylesterase
VSPTARTLLLGALAAVALLCLWQLRQDEAGITRTSFRVGGTPVTVYRSDSAGPAPVVLVGHGFSGSRRLMEPLALALAGRGYTAVTWDFLGHGRHPRPLRGDLQEQSGTPSLLMAQTGRVAEAALERPGVDGRLALAGHSMATNILVRYAQEAAPASTPVSATVGISMFAPTVDSTSPPNLLAVVGALEGRLVEEARRVVAMVADVPPAQVEPFTTYGDPAGGTARRFAPAPWVEHVGVLYSATTLEETADWLDATFSRAEPDPLPGRAHGRGLWIALLMTTVFLLAYPLTGLLPRVSRQPLGADAGWRRLLLAGGLPALLTPLLLRLVPTSFLPVVVGDYVAVHFLTVGLLGGAVLWWTGGRPGLAGIAERAGLGGGRAVRAAVAAGAMVVFFLLLVAWPLDRYFTSFVPTGPRVPLLLAVLVGTLPYFLVDEWLTRGPGARRGAYPATKLFFLLSLVVAVALDFEALFFLILIIPLVLAFFVVHGLFSRWAYRSTGSPLVAAVGNAVAFAWALAVTFPLYAGG